MKNILPLSKFRKGMKGIIQRHDSNEFELILMEMGCLPGEALSVEVIAPMGDPMAIKVAGYFLSIRKKEAERIWVEAQL